MFSHSVPKSPINEACIETATSAFKSVNSMGGRTVYETDERFFHLTCP